MTDLADPEQRAAFFQIHGELPREGPGNRDCTERALALAGALPQHCRVLDVACGPGAQTIDLAQLLPAADIVALDFHKPFPREVGRRAQAAGCADRVSTVVGDMHALPFAPNSFDLIWCEGAAYIMGLVDALRAWKALLAPGGCVAVSEAVWLNNDPPTRVRACWEEYPAMTHLDGCRQRITQAGLHLRGDFVLPKAAWDTYYDPMRARVSAALHRFADDPVGLAVAEEAAEEIAVFDVHNSAYSYVFLVADLGS